MKRLKNIESYFNSHDHHRLYYKAYYANDPKACLVFVHGLNEHSGRYQNPLKYFKKDYNIYLFDQRGHGKSDGLRSYVDNFNTYLKDLQSFIDLVSKKEQKRKIFLIGHSMGGQVVLNYVAKYSHNLSGFMTSSPNIQTAIKIPLLKKVIGLQLAKILPKFKLPNEIDNALISHDSSIVQSYADDPLVSQSVSLGLVREVFKNQEKILSLASQTHLPALMMHSGDDKICHVDGSKKYFRKLASKDKTLKIYKGFYHEIFNEIGKEQAFQDMEDWLNSRI